MSDIFKKDIASFITEVSPYRDWFVLSLKRVKEEWPACANVSLERQILLIPYVQTRPIKFFNRDAYRIARKALDSCNPSVLSNIPTEVLLPLEHGLSVLRMHNNSYTEFYPHRPTTDESLGEGGTGNEVPQELLEQETREVVLSDYAMIAENVFKNLIRLLLFSFFNSNISKMSAIFFSFDFIDLWNNAKKHLGMRDVYDPLIRNAIAHGRVKFMNDQVVFIDLDKRKQELRKTLHINDAVRLADNLLDVCNGFWAAIVESVVLGGPLASLEMFQRTEALSLMQTPFLRPTGVFMEDTAQGGRVSVYGNHSHWNLESLWVDIARAFVITKNLFPSAHRFFANFEDSRRVSYFYNIDNADIPSMSQGVKELYVLARKLPDSGFGWIEHRRLLIHYLNKLPRFASALHWIHDINFSFPTSDSPQYELRHFKDISVNWHSRFDAIVISHPRASDLDEEGNPTEAYLAFLSRQTTMRWLIRESGERNFGASRLKLFKTGFISVHPNDGRLTELQHSASWMFKFESPVVAPLPIIAKHWKRIGRFYVLINPACRDFLSEVKKAG